MGLNRKAVRKASLLDLPSELVLQILEFVGDVGLYRLALLSRGLHYAALPLYLARHGIDVTSLPTSGQLQLFENSVNTKATLRGLRISLFVTSIKCLICRFHFPESDLLWEVRSLYRILSKLTHVEEVILDFTYLPRDMKLQGVERLKDLQEWRQAFGKLVQTMFGKSCSSLTARQGDILLSQPKYLWQTSRPEWRPQGSAVPSSPSGLRRFFSAFTRRAPRPREDVHFSESMGTRSRGCGPSTRAETSNPNPLLVSIIEALNKSGITSLTFEVMDLPPSEWAAILPRVNVPGLSSLSLHSCNVPFPNLSEFLGRHPSITSLKYSDPSNLPSLQPSLPDTILPRLTTLCASVEYIAYLLTPIDAFPNLCCVSIASHITATSDFAHIDSALTPVAQRIRGTRLSLKLFVHSSGWLSIDSDENGVGAGAKGCLQHVSSLEIHAGWYGLNSPMHALLPHWLAMFPLLHRVSFIDLTSWTSDSDVKAALIRSIGSCCTGVTAIVINGQEHNIRTYEVHA